MTLKPNLIVIAVLGWACSNLVFAQQVPGGAQPGQIERQLQKPPQPRAGGDAIVPPTPDQKPPANADNVRFMLNRVTVDGSTVYKDAELQSAAASFVGKEVTLTQIYRIAEALTRRYRNDGYILSQVVVPAQNIQNGAVRLQVIEGYVATARVTGANRVSTWQLEAFLAPVLKARPLNAQVLERSLLLINDLAGVTARTTLSPSQQPGAADLTVNVAESARSIKLGVNNRGGKFLGPLRLTADADFNSVFGGGDRTGLRLIRTPLNSELTLVSASHERPVGANGLKLNGSMSFTRAYPGVGITLPNLQTNSVSAQAGVSYPIIRSRLQNLSVRGSFGLSNGKSESIPIAFRTHDQITAARIGFTWDGVDALRGVNIIDMEYSQGMKSFGASDRAADGSRANVPAGFQKFTYYGARLQSVAPKWSMLGAISGQLAMTNLLAPEQYTFGGEQMGRGHDAADLIGDSGAGLKFELRYNDTGSGILRDYMTYGFYDVGSISRRTPAAGELKRQSAASTGLGIRFNLQRDFSGYVELGMPLIKNVAAEGNRSARLFAGVQANF